MNKQCCLFLMCLLLSLPSFAQKVIRGTITDRETNAPLAFADIVVSDQNHQLTDIDGTFELVVPTGTEFVHVEYAGYRSQKVTLLEGKENYEVQLEKAPVSLNKVLLKSSYLAEKIIRQAIRNKPANDPKLKLGSFQYKSYSKFFIDDQQGVLEVELDSSRTEIQTVVNTGRAFLSEKISSHVFEKKAGAAETVVATKTAGFEEPVYEFLTVDVQSFSWYGDKYEVFDSEYAGPLGKNAFKNYEYQILDTTQAERPAFLVYFRPKRQKSVAGLEGVLYIDTLSFAIQAAKGQLKGKVSIETQQEYAYFPMEEIWFPTKNTLVLKPGKGGQDVSVFGGNISIGAIPEKIDSIAQARFMRSVSINSDIELNPEISAQKPGNSMEILPGAASRKLDFWQKNRKLPFSEKDQATFARVDSIIKAENIVRKIEVAKKFNTGYFPVGFFDVDLRTLVKYNNYEGLRLGVGGLTNEKLSNNFRVGGYVVYGFKDHTYKYNFQTGLLLNKAHGTWLNLSYTSDLYEVGSFLYLTDRRVYSLFEPRLVNIDFYYEHQTLKASLQHRITSKLLSEWQFSKSNISQTRNYYFQNDRTFYHNYNLTEATLSLRWNPFGEYLSAPGKLIEIEKNYPKFSAQLTQAFDGFLKGDFAYTKVGLKMTYIVDRINQSSTELIVEANGAFGDVPLTHAFHAYPNSPNRETIARRFSVAGRQSFETMYFSEFFSDRLASLHLKHRFRPWEIAPGFAPRLVLITRHAIGNMSNFDRHYGLNFNTMEKGYSETGFEINKIFYGFGLSFAYRYGAYHLPKLEDNISAKFTFYFDL